MKKDTNPPGEKPGHDTPRTVKAARVCSLMVRAQLVSRDLLPLGPFDVFSLREGIADGSILVLWMDGKRRLIPSRERAADLLDRLDTAATVDALRKDGRGNK